MTTSLVWGSIAPRTERALLAAAQRDDQRAQDELLRRYEPLVQGTLRRMRLPARVDREDIAQEARIGLLRATLEWRPGRAPFAAYAARCIRNRVIMVLNNAGRHKHRVLNDARSLDAPMPIDRRTRHRDGCGSYDELPGPAPGPDATVLAREQIAAMLAGMPTLTTKERVALLGMLNGRSQQQLADELGGTAKAFALALRRARDKLGACAAVSV
ncbi:MAG: sigma-70 family RNA polymerase sigma factor [Solirubrobacteraceae bacterium]